MKLADRRRPAPSPAELAAGYRRRIARSEVPEYVRPEVERQLRRLGEVNEGDVEHGWIVAYLEWMLELPWSDRLRVEQLQAMSLRHRRFRTII